MRGHWCQGTAELGPGADAELAEHLVQVVADGAFADVTEFSPIRQHRADPGWLTASPDTLPAPLDADGGHLRLRWPRGFAVWLPIAL